MDQSIKNMELCDQVMEIHTLILKINILHANYEIHNFDARANTTHMELWITISQFWFPVIFENYGFRTRTVRKRTNPKKDNPEKDNSEKGQLGKGKELKKDNSEKKQLKRDKLEK